MGCKTLKYQTTSALNGFNPFLRVVYDKNSSTSKKSIDYFPFGSLMPGRSNPLNMVDAGGHRYGFQGQELDDEIKGVRGGSVNYEYRMHDPRVGRFFAVDPLAKRFPFWSPYVFSGNQVIHTVELEGLETEENLNNNEVENTNQQESSVFVTARNGVEGEKLGYSGNERWEFYSPIYVVKEGPMYQIENFAEAVNGEPHVNPKNITKSYVSVCEKSAVGEEVKIELKKIMGVDFENLSKSEKRELLKVKWTKEDMSELFVVVDNHQVYSRTVPITVPVTARPIVVVKSGEGFSSANTSINAQALARTIVNEFAKTAKGKQAARAAKKASSADSEYNQEAEHTSNKSPSKKGKHQKGQERKGRDKGGEKGDKRRVRYK